MAQTTLEKAFNTYRKQFKEITRRSQTHFKDCDWHAMRLDATRRLELYTVAVDGIETGIRQLLGNSIEDKKAWVDLKATP